MNINKTYQKYNNKFLKSNRTSVDEYIKCCGTWPHDQLINIFMDMNYKNNIITPKIFFTTLESTLLTYLDAGEYNNNITNILIYNINNSPITNSSSSILQTYFDEIKDIYENAEDKTDKLEYTEENRQAMLEQSLKMVIHMAKRYQGMGVDLEDLISAGNVGLCIAWDKFDPNRNTVREKYVDILNESPYNMSREYIEDMLKDVLQYGKNKTSFNKYFEDHRTYNVDEVLVWLDKNIKKAKFSSVANMWIRAYIMQEINNNSRLVKKPKSEIDKDKLIDGSHSRETLLYFDNEEEDSTYQNVINIKEMQVENDDICNEKEALLHYTLNRLMNDLPIRDRNIILRTYGIGYPKPQSPKEIAIDLNITVARVSQIILNSIEKIKSTATLEDKNILLEAIK